MDHRWSIALPQMSIVENEVHVWRADVRQSLVAIRHLWQFLSPEELTRANRFRFEKDRQRFIVSQGLLRTLLGHYLGIAPNHLRFSHNSYGKPALDLVSGKNCIHFNLSHSHDLVLYAFACNRQVGIDIEYMRSAIDYEELAKRFFSPYEYTVLQTLPTSAKQQAFFDCWTRKEAYIKARGEGLSLPLHLFDVSLKPGEPAMLLHSREDTQAATHWSLQELALGPGYVGTLAVEGSEFNVSYWQADEQWFARVV